MCDASGLRWNTTESTITPTLRERMEAAEAEVKRLRDGIEDLADLWRSQRAEYPLFDYRSSVAFSAVKLCEEELRALLAESGDA